LEEGIADFGWVDCDCSEQVVGRTGDEEEEEEEEEEKEGVSGFSSSIGKHHWDKIFDGHLVMLK
jgi:hypothetical protein